MARGGFRYFVMFAEMRTGSNFLEQSINQFDDLKCYGELFNPRFIGGPNKSPLFGLTVDDREKDPFQLIEAIQTNNPARLAGFRYFNNHDHRVLKVILDDSNCAKVILTRNPLDSYVSLKIAEKTGQWKLTDVKHKKSAKIEFASEEFQTHLQATQDFQVLLLNALQTTGQTAFYINYEDINSVDVLNGLARFLGSDQTVKGLKANLKRQNPSTLDAKVVNFDEMAEAVSKIDFLNLTRTPNFEPRRGAGVPGYVAGDAFPVLFLPINGAPDNKVRQWMKNHENGKLATGFNQKSLRQWRHKHPGHQCLTVVRHPVARAYHSFCTCILPTDNRDYKDVRAKLKDVYKLKLPREGAETTGYTLEQHKGLFLNFLAFLKGNLLDQTRIKIDPAWASQSVILTGASDIAPPHHIIKEEDLDVSLAHVERLLSLPSQPIDGQADEYVFLLAEVYDEHVETAVRDAYMRDYLYFGFSDWRQAAFEDAASVKTA